MQAFLESQLGKPVTLILDGFPSVTGTVAAISPVAVTLTTEKGDCAIRHEIIVMADTKSGLLRHTNPHGSFDSEAPVVPMLRQGIKIRQTILPQSSKI